MPHVMGAYPVEVQLTAGVRRAIAFSYSGILSLDLTMNLKLVNPVRFDKTAEDFPFAKLVHPFRFDKVVRS